MGKTYTVEELEKCSKEELMLMLLSMQDQMERMNAKYVNSLPLYRIEQEFSRNGVNISRQVMAGWIIRCCERYLVPMYDCLKERLLEYPVTQ